MYLIEEAKHIHKYLKNYGEQEAISASNLVCTSIEKGQWKYCLVIPAYQESSAFYQRLTQSLLKTQNALLILVINQPDTFVEADTLNTQLWHQLINTSTAINANNNVQLCHIPTTNSDLMLVDRFTNAQQIPFKQGVGLARKIGADIALTLISTGHLKTPWIYSSDADAHLPDDYFSALHAKQSVSKSSTAKPSTLKSDILKSDTPSGVGDHTAAALYPFTHRCHDDSVGKATQLYEAKMQQYVDGLHAAGSPYAFHTIGSTLALSAKHYAQVRGFPKRSAGEDFYLLNKLAKTGAICPLQTQPIQIDARLSTRVPFGTGPAIGKLLAEDNLEAAKIFYDPDVFTVLKTWLDSMPKTQTTALENLCLSETAVLALRAIGTEKAIEATRKISRTPQRYIKHMHTWFDAFKTLKFIHALRSDGAPNVALKHAKIKNSL